MKVDIIFNEDSGEYKFIIARKKKEISTAFDLFYNKLMQNEEEEYEQNLCFFGVKEKDFLFKKGKNELIFTDETVIFPEKNELLEGLEGLEGLFKSMKAAIEKEFDSSEDTINFEAVENENYKKVKNLFGDINVVTAGHTSFFNQEPINDKIEFNNKFNNYLNIQIRINKLYNLLKNSNVKELITEETARILQSNDDYKINHYLENKLGLSEVEIEVLRVRFLAKNQPNEFPKIRFSNGNSIIAYNIDNDGNIYLLDDKIWYFGFGASTIEEGKKNFEILKNSFENYNNNKNIINHYIEKYTEEEDYRMCAYLTDKLKTI